MMLGGPVQSALLEMGMQNNLEIGRESLTGRLLKG